MFFLNSKMMNVFIFYWLFFLWHERGIFVLWSSDAEVTIFTIFGFPLSVFVSLAKQGPQTTGVDGFLWRPGRWRGAVSPLLSLTDYSASHSGRFGKILLFSWIVRVGSLFFFKVIIVPQKLSACISKTNNTSVNVWNDTFLKFTSHYVS